MTWITLASISVAAALGFRHSIGDDAVATECEQPVIQKVPVEPKLMTPIACRLRQ